jgi:hypothetical protein
VEAHCIIILLFFHYVFLYLLVAFTHFCYDKCQIAVVLCLKPGSKTLISTLPSHHFRLSELHFCYRSWDSPVGIGTVYRLDGQGLISIGRGKRFFSAPQCADWLWGHPAFYAVGWGAFSPDVKWVGHEADSSPSSSAKVKNMSS